MPRLEHHIASELRSLRRAKQNGHAIGSLYTIRSVASQIGVSHVVLYQWEEQITTPGSLDKLRKWCQVLGRDLKEFL